MAKNKKNTDEEAFKNLHPEQIVLSAQDFDRLVEALNNPPPPSKKLLEARARYLNLKKQEKEDKDGR